ncbi:hypothetical protein H072_708 [Dactylellina haptotyla CBS 200.50]|uniref:Uncharacterized protein n=1 Tax=Dactylellina haptotyla (strain CBS 200.50) TaxID=1284197 RepID=S8AR58_DACHA|nr:hypothetical protein H072_708 [Dactylellina haptotyla CBS 200.50]
MKFSTLFVPLAVITSVLASPVTIDKREVASLTGSAPVAEAIQSFDSVKYDEAHELDRRNGNGDNQYPGATPGVKSNGVWFRQEVPAGDRAGVLSGIGGRSQGLDAVLQAARDNTLGRNSELWCTAGWHTNNKPGQDTREHATFRVWDNVKSKKPSYSSTFHLYKDGSAKKW